MHTPQHIVNMHISHILKLRYHELLFSSISIYSDGIVRASNVLSLSLVLDPMSDTHEDKKKMPS